MSGIDVAGRMIDLAALETDLEAGGVAVPNGLTITGPAIDSTTVPFPPPTGPQPCAAGALLFMSDPNGKLAELPPEAQAIVDAYVYSP